MGYYNIYLIIKQIYELTYIKTTIFTIDLIQNAIYKRKIILNF
jgi:hypothetical protein